MLCTLCEWWFYGDLMGLNWFWWDINGIYSLVLCYIVIENHFLYGKTHYKWSFSIVILNYQRVDSLIRFQTDSHFTDVASRLRRSKCWDGHWYSTCLAARNSCRGAEKVNREIGDLRQRILRHWNSFWAGESLRWSPCGLSGSHSPISPWEMGQFMH